MSGSPIEKLPLNPGVGSRVYRLWRPGSKYLIVPAEMERHGIKPLPALDLMKKRDLEIYAFSADVQEPSGTRIARRRRQTNQTTADPEESTADQNSISFAAVLKQVLGSYLGIDPGGVIVTNL
jgi:hypothetical protein